MCRSNSFHVGIDRAVNDILEEETVTARAAAEATAKAIEAAKAVAGTPTPAAEPGRSLRFRQNLTKVASRRKFAQGPFKCLL